MSLRTGLSSALTTCLLRSYHQYKFIVDGEWRHDESQPYMPDPLGNVNNWLFVRRLEQQPQHSQGSALSAHEQLLPLSSFLLIAVGVCSPGRRSVAPDLEDRLHKAEDVCVYMPCLYLLLLLCHSWKYSSPGMDAALSAVGQCCAHNKFAFCEFTSRQSPEQKDLTLAGVIHLSSPGRAS